MSIRHALFAAAALVPLTLAAQTSDSLRVGDRIRVTVAASRGNTNVFIGTLDRLSPDTLVVAIPGGKGSVILPRLAISEISKSAGHESRWAVTPHLAIFALPMVTLV